MQVAVIGAGLAGLTAARALHDAGVSVSVFEKSRGVGGRMPSRRSELGAFDHGGVLLPLSALELAAPGVLAAAELHDQDGVTHRFAIPVGGANAWAKSLADGLTIHLQARVSTAARTPTGWELRDERGVVLAHADALMVSAPSPQTAELLASVEPELASIARGVEWVPCWAAMVAFAADVAEGVDLVQPAAAPFTRAARQSALPGRAAGERWVISASASWSREHLEAEPDWVAAELTAAFLAEVGAPGATTALAMAHRWRYASAVSAVGEPVLQAHRLAVGGDWCLGSGSAEAVRSGAAAARALLR